MKLFRIYILLSLMLCMGFTSCTVQRHQKGGGATTNVAPATTPAKKPESVKLPDNVNFVGGQDLHMGINQPENPEGISTMSSKQTTTTVYPDGVIVVANTETKSSIGGSQKMAEILQAYVGSEYFKGLLAGLGLMVGAWFMYKKDWELVAAILFIGAIFCIFWSWLAAPIAVGLGVAAAAGHWKTKAIDFLT